MKARGIEDVADLGRLTMGEMLIHLRSGFDQRLGHFWGVRLHGKVKWPEFPF